MTPRSVGDASGPAAAPPPPRPGPARARARAPRGTRRRAARSAPPGRWRPARAVTGRTSTASSRPNETCSSASSAIPCAAPARPVRHVSQTHTPRPSYPPLTAFSTTGQPVAAANAATSSTVATGVVPRAGDAQPAEPLAHGQLVLGVTQRAATRGQCHPGRRQRGQVLPRHVLVIEGDARRTRGRRPAGRPASGSPRPRPRGQPGRRCRSGRVGQHPEPDAERDGRLVRHPGQLPAADHAHHRGDAPSVRNIGHPP